MRPGTAVGAGLLLLIPALSWAGPDKAARRSPVVQAVDRVGPSVVNISTEQRVQNPFAGTLLESRFALPGGGFVENSLGSGVVVDPRGYILTNEHVLWGASRITVSLANGGKYEAEVVGTDPDSDLAVIRVQRDEPFPAVPLGSAEDLMIGETVIAIGNPLGLSSSVTVGVVSALGRQVRGGERTYADFIQIDAPINPGNSGGALLNILGELIGINTSIVADAEGIGFSIPVDRARVVLDEILNYGKVREVWLGIDVHASGGGRSVAAERPRVAVLRSYVGGPADRAGVRPGDVIVAAGGRPVQTLADWDTAVRSATVGKRLPLQVERDGHAMELEVLAETFPYALAPDIVADVVGIELADISGEMRRQADLPPRGVVVTGVRPGSAAARTGFRPGDVIRRVNDSRVDTMEDVAQAVPRMLERQSVLFIVVRGPFGYYVTLDLN